MEFIKSLLDFRTQHNEIFSMESIQRPNSHQCGATLKMYGKTSLKRKRSQVKWTEKRYDKCHINKPQVKIRVDSFEFFLTIGQLNQLKVLQVNSSKRGGNFCQNGLLPESGKCLFWDFCQKLVFIKETIARNEFWQMSQLSYWVLANVPVDISSSGKCPSWYIEFWQISQLIYWVLANVKCLSCYIMIWQMSQFVYFVLVNVHHPTRPNPRLWGILCSGV